MRINTNVSALNAWRNLSITNLALTKSLERLSSGLRINRAADDAAGLAISEKMRAQIRGLNQAARNAQDGISLIQTAEGALNETHSILQRMRELAVQAASDTLTADDRDQIQKEMDRLIEELNRIANTTEFNTKKLLNGDLSRATNSQGTKLQSSKLYASGTSGVATTKLVSLEDENGNTLGIASGDTIVIEFTKGGTYFAASFKVATGTTVSNLASAIDGAGANRNTTVSSARLVVSGPAGLANSVGGMTITVKDPTGNIRTKATDYLSAWTKLQDAQDKTPDDSAVIHIGANTGQNLKIDINNMTAAALGVDGLKVETQSQANIAVKVLDEAIAKVSTERAKLGALQNRLEHTINNLSVASENLSAAESRIRDADMAQEMMNFVRTQILLQSGTAMLAQANAVPQSVLQLLA